jgi:hypothetical protein
MSVCNKVHRCEFLRIITKVQKEVKQWVKAKCKHEGMLQQGYNLLMIKQENTTKWREGDRKKMSKTSQKGPTRKGPPRVSQRETPKRKIGKGILKASQKGLEYEVDTKHYERTKKQRLPPSIMKGIEGKH